MLSRERYMIDSMGGFGFAAMSRETFGAQVVSKTLDFMNNSGGGISGFDASGRFALADKQTFGAGVVSKTLENMNSGNGFGGSKGFGGSVGSDFDFQTSVLGAAFAGKGAIADMTA
jgi:hypothetical protein